MHHFYSSFLLVSTDSRLRGNDSIRLPRCLFEIGNHNLLHRQESLRHSVDLRLIPARHDLIEIERRNLPNDPEFILTPAALLRGRHGRQFRPVHIQLFLGLYSYNERDRFVELEDVAAVDGHESLTVQLELIDEGVAAGRRGIVEDGRAQDFRVRKDRNVILDRGFNVFSRIEPQVRGDGLDELSHMVGDELIEVRLTTYAPTTTLNIA